MDQEGSDSIFPSQKRMPRPRSSGRSPFISLPYQTSDSSSEISECSSVRDHENFEHDFTQGVSRGEQEREMFSPLHMEREEAAANVDASQMADAKVDACEETGTEDVFEEYHRCGLELNRGLKQSHRLQRRLKNKLAQTQQQCSLMKKKSELQKRKLVELHQQSESTSVRKKALNEEVATDFTAAHAVIEQSIQGVSQNAACIEEVMSNIDKCLEKDASEMSELKSEMTLCMDNAHNKNSKYSSELSSETHNYKESTLTLYKKILEVDRKIENKIEALRKSKLESLRKESLIKQKEALLKADLEETAHYETLIEQEKIKVAKNKRELDMLNKLYEKKSASFEEETKANLLKLHNIQAERKKEEKKSKKYISEMETLMQKENEVSRDAEIVKKQIGTLCEQIEKGQQRNHEKKKQLEIVTRENERLKKRWEEHERLKLVEEAALKEYQNLKAWEEKKRDEYNQLLLQLDKAEANVASSNEKLKKLKGLKEKANRLDKEYAEALKRNEVSTSDSQRVAKLKKTLEDLLNNIQLEEERNLNQLKDIESIRAEINSLKLRTQSMDNQIEQKTKEKEKIEKESSDLNNSLVEIRAMVEALDDPTAELEKMEGADLNLIEIKNQLDFAEDEFRKFEAYCQDIEQLKLIPSFQPYLQEIENLKVQKSKLESFRNEYLVKQKKQHDRYNKDVANFNQNCATQRETSTKLLNELIQHCQAHHKMIGDHLNHYQSLLLVKNKNVTVISGALKGIQRRIEQPILRMAAYINFTKNADRHSLDVQIKIYNEFSKVCNSVWSESVVEPENILNIACCLFGPKPKVETPSPNTSVVSSTNTP